MYIGLKAKEREHTEQGNNGPRSSSLPASSTADARRCEGRDSSGPDESWGSTSWITGDDRSYTLPYCNI